jgi:H+/gluconate symporter-like permease
MLIILVISVAQAQYTQTTQLAAIFSGWITTIVAFYFYGQSSAQAQTQIKAATQTAANSEQRAIQAERKIKQHQKYGRSSRCNTKICNP